jgi:hypothetical protein
MNTKSIITLLVVAGPLLPATMLYPILQNTPFVTETIQDIKEAFDNIPQRVPYGPEVRTLAGQQISPGVVRSDFRANQEIYNDIFTIQQHMLTLMQMVLDAGKNPSLMPQIQAYMDDLIRLITNAGIKYNFSFANKIQRLQEIMAELKATPRNAEAVVSPFMLLKVRLETILAELENALNTKFSR